MPFIKQRPIIATIVAIAVVVVVGYTYFNGNGAPASNFIIANRDELIQEVSVTGKVKPARSVDLAFEKTGRITEVRADTGDFVGTGQVLVRIDNSELSAQLAKAEADLTTNKANLEKAKLVLQNYYSDVADVLNDSYTKASDATRKQLDELFSDDETNPQLTFSTASVQNETDLESMRLMATTNLNVWLDELKLLAEGNTSHPVLETMLTGAGSKLTAIRNLLDLAMETVTSPNNLPPASITTYRTDINTARANVNTSLSNVNSKEQDIRTQKATITSEEAVVASYGASVLNIKAQIEKTNLYSPISGTVTVQDASVGEIAVANSIIVSIISTSQFEIEANVPEADISKLNAGDTARITLDAYGNDITFEAKVIAIDPAETVLEGVATYKTTLKFLREDKRVKSGMTANIDILTARKENVIAVPQRAVITMDGEKFVRIETGGKEPEERKVETGLRGSYGDIEITSGIEEGEKVITFVGE